MIAHFFSSLWNALGTAILSVAVSVFSFVGLPPLVGEVYVPVPVVRTPVTSVTSTTEATSTASRATSTPPVPPKISSPKPVTPPGITPAPTVPIYILPNPSAPSTTTPVVTVTPPPVIVAIGTTTISVRLVPLLSGGAVHAGQSVPVSYLQMTNVGSAGAQLKGFWIAQNGTASTSAIIGLSTVDDRGGSRGYVGGTEGTVLFHNGLAFAPTDAYFAPGQMRLFTIKAQVTRMVAPYIGQELTISVNAVETTGAVTGQFPIPGTTWTIVQ